MELHKNFANLHQDKTHDELPGRHGVPLRVTISNNLHMTSCDAMAASECSKDI